MIVVVMVVEMKSQKFSIIFWDDPVYSYRKYVVSHAVFAFVVVYLSEFRQIDQHDLNEGRFKGSYGWSYCEIMERAYDGDEV